MLSADMRGRRLMTELLVDLDAQGNLLSEPRVVRGSGDARFDESAVRALRKASPLPAPPEAGVWTIGFCPECRG
jgi:TonB family protein